MFLPIDQLNTAYFYVVRDKQYKQVDMGIAPLLSLPVLTARAVGTGCSIQVLPLNHTRH